MNHRKFSFHIFYTNKDVFISMKLIQLIIFVFLIFISFSQTQTVTFNYTGALQTWGPVLTSGISFDNFELKVYNRWGIVIWESYDVNKSWDGTFNGILVPDGTYTWTMKLDMLNNDGKKLVTGHVTIIK